MNPNDPIGQEPVVESELTDAACIGASLDCPEAFAPVFDRHFDALHGYLARRAGTGVADDLAAEIFTIAFAARARYDQSYDDARPWLYGIAARVLSRHHRSNTRGARARLRLAGRVQSAASAADVDDRIVAVAAFDTVARGLAHMSEGDRDALLLFAWEDCSYDDIARVLDIPIGTVRSRLHRARRVLRELLEASGQGTDDTREAGGTGNG